MDIKTRTKEMDALVAQGEIVEAVRQFFAEEASTSDYGKVTTSNKAQMIEKMEGFAGAIQKVNGISHHNSIVDGNAYLPQNFTFDFDMADGSKIYWHEIIKRKWNQDGYVVQEE